MRLFSVAGIFFALLTIGLSQNDVVDYQFDCHRYTNICKNDGTCPEDAACVCTDDYDGFDCSNEKADSILCTVEPPVVNPCQNGGTCYKSGLVLPASPARCSCPFGYYGSDCSTKLVDITCSGATASYALTFPPEFDGRVILVNSSDFTSLNDVCPFDDPTEKGGRKTYNLTVDITEDDSQNSTCKKSNLLIFDEPKQTFQAKIKVFYTQSLDTDKDEYFTLNCTHNTEDGEVSIDITDVDFNQENLDNLEEGSEYNAFELEITDDQSEAIAKDTSVSVGQKVSLDLYPRENSGYAKVFFTSCVANNTLTGTDASSLMILNKGCPTLQALVVSASQVPTNKTVKASDGTDVTKTGVSVSFSVFKFSGNSNQIGITCLARACQDGDTRCDMPTNCTEIMQEDSTNVDTDNNGGNGGTNTEGTGGRKKRAAGDEEQTISKVFRVVGSKQDEKNVSTENEKEEFVDPVEKCLARAEITAVVAVLSATVCVLLIVCFILACVILRRRGKHISSFDRPVLQPKPDRFEIPRAHVNESYEIM